MRLSRWLDRLSVPLFAIAFVEHLRGDHDKFSWFFLSAMALIAVAGIVRRCSSA